MLSRNQSIQALLVYIRCAMSWYEVRSRILGVKVWVRRIQRQITARAQSCSILDMKNQTQAEFESYDLRVDDRGTDMVRRQHSLLNSPLPPWSRKGLEDTLACKCNPPPSPLSGTGISRFDTIGILKLCSRPESGSPRPRSPLNRSTEEDQGTS